VLYHLVCYSNQTTFTFDHTSLLKSTDGGANWINSLGQKNVMPPDTLSGSTFPSNAWGEVNFVKYGAGGAAPPVDNAQTYVYMCGEGKYLARIRRTDLPKLDKSLFQFYTGGDGTADSNWASDISRAVSISPDLPTWATAMTYNPALGVYVMTSDLGNSWVQPPTQGVLNVMVAPHPWGPWTLVLHENMTPKEHDNIAWAFLQPKFTSSDGKKMWMSAAGRAPYGLQFLPLYLSTAPVQVQEAENGTVTGGSISTAIPGYSGSGYVSGLDAPGNKWQCQFDVGQSGLYLAKLRYDTSADRDMDLYVNGQKISSLVLGKSEAPGYSNYAAPRRFLGRFAPPHPFIDAQKPECIPKNGIYSRYSAGHHRYRCRGAARRS